MFFRTVSGSTSGVDRGGAAAPPKRFFAPPKEKI